jgi:hypothetical protein
MHEPQSSQMFGGADRSSGENWTHEADSNPSSIAGTSLVSALGRASPSVTNLQNRQPGSEQQEQRSRNQAGEIASLSQGKTGVAKAVAQFQNCPKPSERLSCGPVRAHRNSPAPQTERDKRRVYDQEAQGEIVADEAAHKPGRCKYLVQPGGVFLDGVCPLGEDQKQENDLASAFQQDSCIHKARIITPSRGSTQIYCR